MYICILLDIVKYGKSISQNQIAWLWFFLWYSTRIIYWVAHMRFIQILRRRKREKKGNLIPNSCKPKMKLKFSYFLWNSENFGVGFCLRFDKHYAYMPMRCLFISFMHVAVVCVCVYTCIGRRITAIRFTEYQHREPKEFLLTNFFDFRFLYTHTIDTRTRTRTKRMKRAQ